MLPQAKGKAQKRRRDGVETVASESKKVKKEGDRSAKVDKADGRNGEGVTADVKESKKVKKEGFAKADKVGGEKQLVKTGFFSGEKFADLPLSEGMHTALANLKFTTTTKIQASRLHKSPL